MGALVALAISLQVQRKANREVFSEGRRAGPREIGYEHKKYLVKYLESSVLHWIRGAGCELAQPSCPWVVGTLKG